MLARYATGLCTVKDAKSGEGMQMMMKERIGNCRLSHDYIQQSVDVGGERIRCAKLHDRQSKSTGDDGM